MIAATMVIIDIVISNFIFPLTIYILKPDSSYQSRGSLKKGLFK